MSPSPNPSADPHNLQRFVDAQEPVYPEVLGELRAGRKRSHWIWFIFPQIAGLGSSPTAQFYAIASLSEAEAYIQHPILGPRLRECTSLVNQIEGRSVDEIFAWPDNMKFRSSMTLFAKATQDNQLFRDALEKYCKGEPDQQTLTRL
jgi:uncharacterized protein (DUF1810 family)